MARATATETAAAAKATAMSMATVIANCGGAGDGDSDDDGDGDNRGSSWCLLPKSASTKTLTCFFEAVDPKARVNENVDALSRGCCFQKARQRKR